MGERKDSGFFCCIFVVNIFHIENLNNCSQNAYVLNTVHGWFVRSGDGKG